MSNKLAEAVAVFKELGWHRATPELALTLPLGTPAQRKVALAGLRSGTWGSVGWLAENTYGWISDVDVDEGMLAIFAVRVGVDARRAANVLRRGSDELVTSIVAERGPVFAATFIEHACVARRRMWEHSASRFGGAAVRLVHVLDLPVPENVEYMKDWAVVAAAALSNDAPAESEPRVLSPQSGVVATALGHDTQAGSESIPLDEADALVNDQSARPDERTRWRPPIQARFAEHVRVGLAVGTPATGPFGQVVPDGVARGWLDRDEAVELVFAALDAAGRPGDRKVWLDALVAGGPRSGALGVTDAELLARVDGLIPLLSTGDGFVIERIAPVLIAGVDDASLVEVVTASLATQVKKAIRVVLQAALERARRHAPQRPQSPSEQARSSLAAIESSRPPGADDLADQLASLTTHRDRQVSRLATELATAWSLSPTEQQVTETHGLLSSSTPSIGEASAHDARLYRMWRPTPPVWDVPAFVRGEETPQALTALAAELTQRAAACSDIVEERFLAVANAVARRDPEEARTALRGVRPGADGVLSLVPDWLSGTWSKYSYGMDRATTTFSPLPARDFAVFARLGEVPCLLSEPSTDDLSVHLEDLVARLDEYAATGATASEADLLLAITRLDASRRDAEIRGRLEKLTVPVVLPAEARQHPQSARPDELARGRSPQSGVLQTGKIMKLTAGQAVIHWLDDPAQEPGLELSKRWRSWWMSEPIKPPKWMRAFPDRLREHDVWSNLDFTMVPRWGDAAYWNIGWNSEVQRDQGLKLRQVARRATPLPPGMAINLLAAQRSLHPVAAEDSRRAVAEAWQRGLLRPGVADVHYLDWHIRPPTNLAALVAALTDIANEGILSVVWPLLDDLIAASLNAPRMVAGTADAAEALAALLPEVQAAVASGLAEPSVLGLPGVRALAARPGSSLAVTAARRIVAELPDVTSENPVPITTQSSLRSVMDLSFDEVWPKNAGTAPPIPDGVTMTVDWDRDAPSVLAFDLTLPSRPDHHYLIVKPGWFYDLESEGQCRARELPVDALLADPTRPHEQARSPQSGGADASQDVWLYWDADRSALMPATHRNRTNDTDGPFKGTASRLSDALVAVVVGLNAQDGAAKYFGSQIIRNGLTDATGIGSAAVRNAARVLLRSPAVSPARLVRHLERDELLLPTLWPLLTESVRVGGESANKPPVWLNRVLDVAKRFAPYLVEAARQGLIPAEDAEWTGLGALAASSSKSAVVAKARTLLAALPDLPVHS